MMLVVQATQHHVVGWRDSDGEETTWKDAVMPNGGTEKNNEKPQVRIAGLLVWTTDLQNKEYWPPACKIQYEEMLNWWILNWVLLSYETSIIFHCFSHLQSKNTHVKVKQCCWYSTYQTDSQIHLNGSWFISQLPCKVRDVNAKDDETERMRKVTAVANFKVLLHYLCWGTEENNAKPQSDQSPVWNTNHLHPRYKSVPILAL